MLDAPRAEQLQPELLPQSSLGKAIPCGQKTRTGQTTKNCRTGERLPACMSTGSLSPDELETIIAYITGSVDQEHLTLRNEYLVTENRIPQESDQRAIAV